MTAIRDPYPENLSLIDAEERSLAGLPEASLAPLVPDGYVTALNRIAAALEQIAANRSQPVQNAPHAPLTALPPVRTAPAQTADVCPIHGTPWKVVPAGVSKKTGKAYDAFRACSTQGCDQRPPR